MKQTPTVISDSHYQLFLSGGQRKEALNSELKSLAKLLAIELLSPSEEKKKSFSIVSYFEWRSTTDAPARLIVGFILIIVPNGKRQPTVQIWTDTQMKHAYNTPSKLVDRTL